MGTINDVHNMPSTCIRMCFRLCLVESQMSIIKSIYVRYLIIKSEGLRAKPLYGG